MTSVKEDFIPIMNSVVTSLVQRKAAFNSLPVHVKTLLRSQLASYAANSSMYFSTLHRSAPVSVHTNHPSYTDSFVLRTL
jgi:hypothetical protein